MNQDNLPENGVILVVKLRFIAAFCGQADYKVINFVYYLI